MITTSKNAIEDKLKELVEKIAIPNSIYEEAKNSYIAVGEWLAKETSILHKYNPQIYPQGSFALGTAILPLEDCELDVDAVCLLETTKDNVTQAQLKELVGKRLKENVTYGKMIDPKNGGRRCWTLKYAHSRKFHIDILPAIPCDTINFNNKIFMKEVKKTAIYITDKKNKDFYNFSNDWLKSNPQGYVNWFLDEMKNKTKSIRVYNTCCDEAIEDLPLYRKKHILQRVIQLLKRHRDIKFGTDEDKPISIIITTLATKSYTGEESLYEALLNISKIMKQHVTIRNGEYWIENPVNSEENFADKWKECPRKAELFFSWLNSLNKLFENLLNENIDFSEALDEAYGYIKKNKQDTTFNSFAYMSNPVDSFNLPYRQTPPWVFKNINTVKINATFKKNNQVFSYENNGKPLPKYGTIQFVAKTDALEPYTVQWQILNTGEEARLAGNYQLRGGFYPSEADKKNIKRENTLYKGCHMAQAYIIKNDICIGKSEEFVVNIS